MRLTPAPGSIFVGWADGESVNAVRHSTDEATWTTQTGITANYYEITGLAYATTYYVQTSTNGGSSWSSSSTAAPLIDPDSDLTKLFDKSDVQLGCDYGDTPALEVDTFIVGIRFRLHETGQERGIYAQQANLQSTSGWQRAGAWVRIGADDKADIFASIAGLWESATSTGTYTSTTSDYIWILSKTGTTLLLESYDPSTDSLTTIVSKTLSSSTIEYNASAGAPHTSLNGHFSGASGIVQASKATTRRVLTFSDTPTTTLKENIGRYLAETGTYPQTATDLFVDAGAKDAGTLSVTSVAPTKYGSNPVLNPSTTNSDGGLRWGTVIYDSSGGKYHYWGTVKKESDNTLRCYHADSSDGISWSNESEISTPSNDSTVAGGFLSGSTVYLLLEKVTGTLGAFLYSTTFAGPTTLSAVKTIVSGAGVGEGKSVGLLDDGRMVAYHTTGQGTDLRTINIFNQIDASSVTGQWYTSYTTVDGLEASAGTDQYYSLAVVYRDGDYVVAVGPRYNSTTEVQDLAMYVSRDGGATFADVDATWLNRGSGGSWDDSMIWEVEPIHRVGNDWRWYYIGFPEIHGADPNEAELGYATTGYRRIGSIAGSGTWTTTELETVDASRLLVTADPNGNDLTVAVLDADSGTALTGYDDADCDTISDDIYDEEVTWRGASLPAYQKVKLRFTLASGATLYAYELQDSGGNGGLPSAAVDERRFPRGVRRGHLRGVST